MSTLLSRKVERLLVPDPDGRPMAPETEALLRAASKAEDDERDRVIMTARQVASSDSLRVSAMFVRRFPYRLDYVAERYCTSPSDPMRQTLRKALSWLSETPEEQWPEVMR